MFGENHSRESNVQTEVGNVLMAIILEGKLRSRASGTLFLSLVYLMPKFGPLAEHSERSNSTECFFFCDIFVYLGLLITCFPRFGTYLPFSAFTQW